MVLLLSCIVQRVNQEWNTSSVQINSISPKNRRVWYFAKITSSCNNFCFSLPTATALSFQMCTYFPHYGLDTGIFSNPLGEGSVHDMDSIKSMFDFSDELIETWMVIVGKCFHFVCVGIVMKSWCPVPLLLLMFWCVLELLWVHLKVVALFKPLMISVIKRGEIVQVEVWSSQLVSFSRSFLFFQEVKISLKY